MVVLVTRKRVQIDDRIDAMRSTGGDGAVQMAEAVLDDFERSGVGLNVTVVDRDPDGVEPELCQEQSVGVGEEGGQQAIEEQVILVRTEHVQHRGPHHRLVRRIPGDEVFHVEPAAQAHSLEADRIAAPVEHLSAASPHMLEQGINHGAPGFETLGTFPTHAPVEDVRTGYADDCTSSRV